MSHLEQGPTLPFGSDLCPVSEGRAHDSALVGVLQVSVHSALVSEFDIVSLELQFDIAIIFHLKNGEQKNRVIE